MQSVASVDCITCVIGIMITKLQVDEMVYVIHVLSNFAKCDIYDINGFEGEASGDRR